MAQIKRKDLKGRILHTGESQIQQEGHKLRGRYQFDYTDASGQRKHINSWRLVETDATPKGHRYLPALRTLEEKALQDVRDGIDRKSGNETLNDLFRRYMDTKINLKQTTRNIYVRYWDSYIKDDLGQKKIGNIKRSDVRAFLVRLIQKRGLTGGSMDLVNTLIKSVLEMAARDDAIRKNPAKGVYSEIKLNKGGKGKKKVHALTKQQQTSFVSFLQKTAKYTDLYRIVVFLLGTGARIGEAMALTWADVDMNAGIIHIRRTLYQSKEYENGADHYTIYINTPKKEASERTIPIVSEVRAILEELKEIDAYIDKGYTVAGVSDFIFLNKNGRVYFPGDVRHKLNRALANYDKTERAAADQEHRDPVLIEKITPHMFRHTFCSRLCEVESNLKVIQAIMGHANIKMTMDIYAECTADTKTEAFKRLDGLLTVY